MVSCQRAHRFVKPDIVFFGENLPARFFELKKQDLPAADLLIVMGTSLKVSPFNLLVEEVSIER
jgi:NAD-dependent deacetylase sirtuin 2